MTADQSFIPLQYEMIGVPSMAKEICLPIIMDVRHQASIDVSNSVRISRNLPR